MRSSFCQWLIDLSDIAEKQGIKIEAKYYDGLEHFFKVGITPDQAYPRYLNLTKRIKAINGIEDKPIWTMVNCLNPEYGVEVLGHNKEWIDEDVNPDGICVCYLLASNEWYVAKYCNQHDEWHTRLCGEINKNYETVLNPPTHWREKPAPPNTETLRKPIKPDT